MLPLPLSTSKGLSPLHLIILSKRAVIGVLLGVIVLLLGGWFVLLILRLLGVNVGGLFIGFFRGSSDVGIWVETCIF